MKPLYIQAKEGDLKESQFMDLETLNWIEEISKNEITDDSTLSVHISSSDFKIIKQLLPRKEFFSNEENYESIHGIRHILRVMINILLICKVLKITNSTPFIIAASLHDIRRENDNADVGHGKRASEWFQNNLIKFSEFISDQKDVSRIAVMIEYHETNYESIDLRIQDEFGSFLDIIKAADALDRYRLPKEKWWPKREFIRSLETHSLIPICRNFTLTSEREALKTSRSLESVFNVAKKLFYDDL